MGDERIVRGRGEVPAEARGSPFRLRGHTLETALSAVRELQSGVKAPVVCRRFGVSERTLYRWRRWYGGHTAGATREDERNSRCRQALRAVLASLAPDARARALRAAQAATQLNAATLHELADVEF